MAAKRDPHALTYRPDIDGLRAIAVLGVVAYHTAPRLVSGGFAGVDIFFVISGFLITSIILREKAEGRFSLIDFYGRRVRRLFPALIAVLAATFVIGWTVLLPHEFQLLGKHTTAGAAYFLNFTLKKEAGYFDTSADEKPLLHLWSLSVEEQFYLVWPLLLLVLASRRATVFAIALVIMASFASSMMVIGRKSAFFLPHNRMWELASGSLLALTTQWLADIPLALWRPARALHRLAAERLADVASCAGFALILLALFGLDRTMTYPGGWVLIPCAGALLIIAAGSNAIINRLLLSKPVLVFVGLISYPLYLWHWPLLSFTSILGHGDDVPVRAAAVVIAAFLAYVTYRFIEQPLRRGPLGVVPAGLLAVTLAFCVLGIFAQKDILTARLNDPAHRDISDAVNDWAYPNGLQRSVTPSGLTIHQTGAGDGKILFAGDSNMEQYWPRIQKLREQPGYYNRPVIFATTGGCPPIPGLRRRVGGSCAGFGQRVRSIALSPDVDTVVLGALWTLCLGTSQFYFESMPESAPSEAQRFEDSVITALSSMITDLRLHGKAVWLVLSIPNGPELSPMSSLHRSATGADQFVPIAIARAAVDAAWVKARAALIQSAQAAGAGIIDPMAALCNDSTCPGQTAEGRLMYKDGGHLRASFVRDHATYIDPTMAASPASKGASRSGDR